MIPLSLEDFIWGAKIKAIAFSFRVVNVCVLKTRIIGGLCLRSALESVLTKSLHASSVKLET